MEKVVVDTDIIIDFFRTARGDLPSLLTLQLVGKVKMYLSSLSIFELFSGSSSKKEKVKVLEFISYFTVISVDTELAQLAGEIRRDSIKEFPLADFIIAVSAIKINASLATRNRKHFQGIPKLKFLEMKEQVSSN